MVIAANPVEQASTVLLKSLVSLRLGLVLYRPVKAKIIIQPAEAISTIGQYLSHGKLNNTGRIEVANSVNRKPYAVNPAATSKI